MARRRAGNGRGRNRGHRCHDQRIAHAQTSSTVISYSLYTFFSDNLPRNHAMMWTIPFVLYAIFRYLYLVHQKDRGDSPTDMLLTDRPLLATVALWVALVIVIVYTAHGVATPLGDPG